MQAKHFVNDPEALVAASLKSLSLTNPSLLVDEAKRVIYRGDVPELAEKVSILSGGGSGHEPGFAGYVGKGLLTACIAGSIFASPAASQIQSAIFEHVPVGKGVLILVMNYTGDALNFGLAAEKARAVGIEVEFVIIGDDVSVGRKKGGKVGRRGIAGSVLVAKIAGALAEQGANLADTYRVAKLVSENIASIGCSLSHCHVPGRAPHEDTELSKAGSVEIGMGIHNEPGTCRVEAGLPEVVSRMLAQILDTKDEDRHFIELSTSDEVVIFINNLGGVSVLELGAITTEVCGQLGQTYKIKPRRVISGSFLTSLNGNGWSVTLLKLQDTGLAPGMSMLELLDAPAEAIGWAGPAAVHAGTMDAACMHHQVTRQFNQGLSEDEHWVSLLVDEQSAATVLSCGLKNAIAAEPELTQYDTILGDGDCGTNLKHTAEKVLETLPSQGEQLSAISLARNIANVVSVVMEGTSGAIYSIFLNALVASLRRQAIRGPEFMIKNVWAKALNDSLAALQRYTTAERGNRTMMDALIPFVETFARTQNLREAAKAAREGAESTKEMQASLGRAVYVGNEQDWMGKVPDPGAHGLAALLEGFAKGLDHIQE